MNNNNFKLKAEVVIDKIKSMTNIKSALKSIEAKLSKLKIQGILDSAKIKNELTTRLKSLKPKVKIDADTKQADEKLQKVGQQNAKLTIKPTVDNSQVMSDLNATQKEAKSFFTKFSNSIIGSQLIRMSVQQVTQAIHQAISTVRELDSIKTNVQSVSGINDSKADAVMKSYNQIAKNMSSTTKDIGNTASEIMQLGMSLSDTNRLIESSTMLARLGMVDSSQATEYLISSMKGYQLSTADSVKIVDKLTGVNMEAAVSAGGLAEAISICADTANSSGTSMDRLIGYAAAIGENTQESMSTVGSSLKSFYDRMNNIKTGKLIDDETGESLINAEASLGQLGIRLRDTTDSYRNFDDVLDDISRQWENLTQLEQQELSAAMAGNAQKEHFTNLMNNYADAIKYSETAADSAGSALERYGVYQNSIDAKVNELTASLESLFTNTVSEDLYSGIIQATTGIIKFLDKTQLLKAALTGLAAIGIGKGASLFAGLMNTGKCHTSVRISNTVYCFEYALHA